MCSKIYGSYAIYMQSFHNLENFNKIAMSQEKNIINNSFDFLLARKNKLFIDFYIKIPSHFVLLPIISREKSHNSITKHKSHS